MDDVFILLAGIIITYLTFTKILSVERTDRHPVDPHEPRREETTDGALAEMIDWQSKH